MSDDPTSARSRLDQIEQRIKAKHPRASRDGELAALLEALRDELPAEDED